MDRLARFRQCMQAEADAIEQTAHALDNTVIEALHLFEYTTGKVIVSGIGKSGHVGRKIAASLSSTGTPAHFMHAAEGVHGDLGMITKDDLVILLSNSGETAEVLNLIPSLKMIGAPIIAITRVATSTLAKAADVTLTYLCDTEADDLNLAPTTSSTVMLALGDALAVTLSAIRHFDRKTFHLYHPGGSLGKALEKK
ncbi:MAG: SIS domain-containing protein [Acholeplasmatales bacterium]|nr:MAG: SIS domain-containing protein [Acholeplasmatales bacterium]